MKFKSTNIDDMLVEYPKLDVITTGRGACLDLTCKKVNHLTAIYRSYYYKNKRTGWVCQCDCGKYIFYSTDKLTSGEATTCGPTCPYKKQKTHELTGKRFGRLTVIERAGHSDDGHATWKCKCDCGNETIVEGRYLEHNRIVSCGSCPDCMKSIGNNYINNWLISHNILFKSEVRFIDCRDKYPLIFDFVIYQPEGKIKYCIEYQGNIHYEVTGGWINEETLESQKRRDNIKREYCVKNDIKLIEISYKDFKELDRILEKELLKEK